MKSTHRLQLTRFVEALAERGLVEREALAHVVQQCTATGSLLSELLVSEHLVSDYEIARVSCDVYGLPFLPVESYPPNLDILPDLDPDYLRQYGLVPLDRHGNLLTVAMPGIVPSEVLEGLRVDGDIRLMPVVGSVTTNRRWLKENLPPTGMPELDEVDAALPVIEDADWAGIFDAGDEAVQKNLGLG